MYRKKTKSCPSDVLQVLDRLEKYDNYVKQVRKERKQKDQKFGRKVFKQVQRERYRKQYGSKPVVNPYVELMLKQLREGKSIPGIDKNLLDKYNHVNIYTLFEFRHLPLPRSNYEVKAGQAWHGLINAWKGFKISKAQSSELLMEDYASATQNFAHMLELPMIPDFRDIGRSLEGFLEGKKLKYL